MARARERWTGPALVGGSIGLAVYWAGTKLFFDFGGIFAFGAILVLSTLLLILGIVGLHRLQHPSSAGSARIVLLIGVVVSAIGLMSRSTIALAGLALFTVGSIRAKTLPLVPLALVLIGAMFLGFEEWRYGALLATRNDQPITPNTPITLVRSLAGIGYVAQAIGWSWLGIELMRQSAEKPAS